MWGAWCARCHAQDGSGKIDEPTVTVEPMDFTDCKLTTAEPDADWERAIAKGGPGVGLSPLMPGFEDSLTADQIAGFVSHIRGFCKETGWPSGNNNFPRPIVTEKAFPENEFLILPAVSHDREVRIRRALRATARQALDVRGGVPRSAPRRGGATGSATSRSRSSTRFATRATRGRRGSANRVARPGLRRSHRRRRGEGHRPRHGVVRAVHQRRHDAEQLVSAGPVQGGTADRSKPRRSGPSSTTPTSDAIPAPRRPPGRSASS